MRYTGAAALIVCAFVSTLLSQSHVLSSRAEERMICVVPMAGAGTYSDPKRPAVVPATLSGGRESITGWRYEPSSDGRFAIVEISAPDKRAFAAVQADRRVVAAFVKGKHKRADIEKEIRKYKPDFSLDRKPGAKP
jgi:hypothetical protein